MIQIAKPEFLFVISVWMKDDNLSRWAGDTGYRGSVYDNIVCTLFLAQELYVAQKLFFSNSVIFVLKKIT